jgi:membrane protein implicated in regulation of membrane protease activity
MLTLTYIGLAVLGCGYLAVAVLMGHLFEFSGGSDAHAGHADAAGADHAAQMDYGVDASGHGTAAAGGHGPAAFHFPFFSPLALATLFACIGAYGLISKFGLKVADTPSLLISIPAAFVTAYVVTYLSWRIMSSSRGSSAIRLQDLIGCPAEVITPIPRDGVGEVATLVAGQRFTAPARESEGREVPRGAQVTVLRMSGTTLLVRAGHP